MATYNGSLGRRRYEGFSDSHAFMSESIGQTVSSSRTAAKRIADASPAKPSHRPIAFHTRQRPSPTPTCKDVK